MYHPALTEVKPEELEGLLLTETNPLVVPILSGGDACIFGAAFEMLSGGT